MNCFEVQERIVDLIIGDIEPEEKDLIVAHINQCSICAEEFYFLNECIDACCSCPDFEENEEYWEEFLVSVHERICLTRPKNPFPFHIVVPIAAGALGVMSIVYFLFFRPAPKEIAQPKPDDYNKDPVYEVYDLSPDEQQEFIKMVNQRYFGE
ncbi:MAG: hypothetical protein ACPL28_07440 [bacterium]